ncbi:MAG: hypothetical protein KF789_14790, partial [Bdellovibrionaceae bacterium]|nr:hypothetical protein [Pseudobdellovibrionaceae bacterium]
MLASAGVLSCTPKVGEQAPPPKQQEFSGTACLTEATDYIELFLKGEARDHQVAAAWGCMSTALQAFEKYVRGSSKDSYTAQEISSFIENEFIARQPDGSIHAVPPSLQAEIMKLKKIVAGGNADVITRSEIRSLITKFGHFKDISVRLNPYMKVLVKKWKPDLTREVSTSADVEHFENANRVLQEAALELGAIFEANQSSYRLDDIGVFLRELSGYLGRDWDLTTVVNRFLPLAKKLKKSLTGGREDEILSTEWRLVIVTTLRTYVQYLRYHYFVELPPNVGREQRLTSISRIVEESFSIIETLVREKTDGAVSRQEIDEIASVLTSAWPDFKFSKVMLDEIMKIKKLLFGGATDRIAASDFELARLKVSRIRDLIDILAPYAGIYSGDWAGGKNGGTEASRAEFDKAGAALDRAAQEFGGLLEVGDKDAFDLKGIVVLVKELSRLYPPEGGKGIARTLEKYFPLLQSLKNMVYGDKDALVRKAQWP